MNFSHTKLSTWRRCRQRFHWQYINKYRSPVGLGLIRGGVGHKALAVWYETYDEKKAMQAASDELYVHENHGDVDDPDKIWDLANIVLNRYFAWSKLNDRFTSVEVVEYEFNLPFRDTGHILNGFIDGIVTQTDGTQWLFEHKFYSTATVNHLDLDPQVSVYLYAARQLGFNPRGVLYNVIRNAAGGIAETQPVLRIPVFRNTEGMEALENELEHQLQDMVEYMNSASKRTYRTPTKDCSWDCGYFNACLSINDIGSPDSILRSMPKMEEKQIEQEKDAHE